MSQEQGPFAGRAAIITGGASGIGWALGAELYRRGAHVALADLDTDATRTAVEVIRVAIPGASGSVEGHTLDVTDGEAVDALVRSFASEHRSLDLMFNNAGICVGGPTHEMERVHWDRTVDVNLNGVINGVTAAYPIMIEQGRGHIVNTASAAGLAPTAMTVAYSATKHAVVGLSLSLRPEAATHGVRVSVICPGAVDTPILDRSGPESLPPMPAGTLTGREFVQRIGARPMDAVQFAARALQGVERNQRIIVVPRTAKALWYLHRISPAASERMGRFIVQRAS